jgi:hypothetical protein
MRKIKNKMNHTLNLKVQKRVKDIKGFYTHLIATFIILPFIFLINITTAPQFIWFYYFMIAWLIGLFIHWLNVFILSKNSFKKDWEQKKLKEALGPEIKNKSNTQETDFIQEQYFLKAKKQTKEIKGFYIHLFINLVSIAMIVFINLKFVPGFHFFWFVLGGMFISLFFHWLGIFGFDFLGLGKKWEKRKIKELIAYYK